MSVLTGYRNCLPGADGAPNQQPILGRDFCPGAWQRGTLDACRLQAVCLVAAWPSRQQHSPGHPQLRGVAHQESFP